MRSSSPRSRPASRTSRMVIIPPPVPRPHAVPHKLSSRPSPTKFLLLIRLTRALPGSDDAFLEVCERLSRTRDDTINALVAKDTWSKTSKSPSGRNNADAIRVTASDEFDQGRLDAQERLLKEAFDEEERLSEPPLPPPSPPLHGPVVECGGLLSLSPPSFFLCRFPSQPSSLLPSLGPPLIPQNATSRAQRTRLRLRGTRACRSAKRERQGRGWRPTASRYCPLSIFYSSLRSSRAR